MPAKRPPQGNGSLLSDLDSQDDLLLFYSNKMVTWSCSTQNDLLLFYVDRTTCSCSPGNVRFRDRAYFLVSLILLSCFIFSLILYLDVLSDDHLAFFQIVHFSFSFIQSSHTHAVK